MGSSFPDPERWPSSAGGNGLKPIADKVHAMGLKFGIHVMRGISTAAVKNNTPVLGAPGWSAADIALQNQACSWMPACFVSVNESTTGGHAFIQSLYDLYSSWEVDFIKHDCVFGVDDLSIHEIAAVSKAITATGRPMVYSISPGVRATPPMATLINGFVNMYRVTSDDWDSWNDVQLHFNVARDFAAAGLIGAQGLNGLSWPNLDMLPFGYLTDPGANQGPHKFCHLSPDEQRTQVTFWAMAKSPLMFGGDMLHLDQATMARLTNHVVLDIDAYSYGNRETWELNHGRKLMSNTTENCAVSSPSCTESGENISGHLQQTTNRIWTARGPSGEYYVAFFNLGTESTTITISLASIIHGSSATGQDTLNYGTTWKNYECTGQEVWSSQDLGLVKVFLSAQVSSHGCALFSLQCKQSGEK